MIYFLLKDIPKVNNSIVTKLTIFHLNIQLTCHCICCSLFYKGLILCFQKEKKRFCPEGQTYALYTHILGVTVITKVNTLHWYTKILILRYYFGKYEDLNINFHKFSNPLRIGQIHSDYSILKNCKTGGFNSFRYITPAVIYSYELLKESFNKSFGELPILDEVLQEML